MSFTKIVENEGLYAIGNCEKQELKSQRDRQSLDIDPPLNFGVGILVVRVNQALEAEAD
jgi:hypothetical protein